MHGEKTVQMIDCGGGARLERGVRCRMSDGVELVSDHFYPPQDGARAGPQPTLLMRQPYGRDIASTVVYAHPAWFARHGYNVVIQDVRGRGDSGGEFYPFRHEGRDGAETIAWLRTRPESNGRVGMYGFSYQGMTQLLAAAQRPEGLQCIAPGMTACDLYHGWFYSRSGALRLASSLGWGLQMLKEDARRRKLREASDRLEQAWANLAAQTSVLPFREHPALHGEGVPQYVVDWFDHAEPGEYWREMDVIEPLYHINVPALHVSGWYDTYLEGSIAGFLYARNYFAEPARAHQYLIAGPWLHIPWGDRVGAADFGAEALIDTDAILLRWFDHWLKDSGEFAREPKIRHFVLGENRWRDADTFPTDANHHLYLHSGGRANSRKGDGTLSLARPADDEPCDVFVYDPEVPVVAPGGVAAASGQFDQATLELGNNVLVYTSEPLAQPLYILGYPRVVLFCSSSAAHTDFTAKLVRVKPGGAAEFICIGIARSSRLFSETGYSADRIHPWIFLLEPTSCRFAAGERIRLEIASSAFPLYDRNPGTAVPSCRATSWDWRRSTQFVYHDGTHASALHLPIIEAGEATP